MGCCHSMNNVAGADTLRVGGKRVSVVPHCLADLPRSGDDVDHESVPPRMCPLACPERKSDTDGDDEDSLNESLASLGDVAAAWDDDSTVNGDTYDYAELDAPLENVFPLRYMRCDTSESPHTPVPRASTATPKRQ